MLHSVKVRAPCSTSNLGPGYDVFGLALDAMHDTVEVTGAEDGKITVKMEGLGADTIPTDPDRNTASRTALEFTKRFGGCGFTISVRKGIPPGSGLGSSGASAAATAVGINHLLDLNLEKRELTEIAAQGEIASAGAAHADNVSPAIYGGFTIIYSYTPLEILALPPPNIEFALAVPEGIRKTTKRARAVVPKSIGISKMIRNIGGASYVLAGVLRDDPDLLGLGMLGDVVVEPARCTLYPGCQRAEKAAMDAGASGVCLSGAGPTVIAVVNRARAEPSHVAREMKVAFEFEGLKCREYVSRPSRGALILS